MNTIIEKVKNNQKYIEAIIEIFCIYLILNLLFKFRLLPSFSLIIGNIELPPFQTTQFVFVFPLILFISYILFVRKGIIK